MRRRADLWWTPASEGGLILAIATISWVAKQPLLFASLGPTAYELVELPQNRSARTYNVIVGHLVAVGAGFLSLYLLHAWASPPATSQPIVPLRLWAVALAAGLTAFCTLVIGASQPASLATVLLITLGSMQTWEDAVSIIVGVLIIAALGEPIRLMRLRRLRLKEQQPQTSP